MQLAFEDEPHAHPGADRQEREVVDAPSDAEPPLAERGEVDVVLQRDGDLETVAELVAERASLEARDVRGQPYRSRVRLDDARNADHRAVDQVARYAARVDQRFLQRRGRIQRAVRIRAADLHVLTRPNPATEI